MLTKVRQYREQTARLQKNLKQVSELNTQGNPHFDQDASNGESQNRMTDEEKLKQQVMKGTESLERTSQSIERLIVI